MPTMRELVTKWGFDIEQKPLQEMGKNIFLLKESLSAFYDTAKGAFELTYGLAKDSSEYGKSIQENSDRLGISTLRFQQYAYAALHAGVANEQFNMGLDKMNELRLGALHGDQNAMELFYSYLHIRPADVKAGGEQLIRAIADSAKRMKDAGNKDVGALLEKVTGVRNRNMVNFFEQGSAAWDKTISQMSQFGIKTEAQIAKDEAFYNSVLKVQRSFQAVKDTVGGELYPILEKMFTQFENFTVSKEGQEFIHKDLPLLITQLTKLAELMLKLSVQASKGPFRDFVDGMLIANGEKVTLKTPNPSDYNSLNPFARAGAGLLASQDVLQQLGVIGANQELNREHDRLVQHFHEHGDKSVHISVSGGDPHEIVRHVKKHLDNAYTTTNTQVVPKVVR